MNNLELNDVNINKGDIDDIYIDARRNITITLKNHEKIIVERSETSKKVYNYLAGEYSNDD
jgi:hypothetical protein